MGRKFALKEPFTLHDVLDHIEGRARESQEPTIDFIPPPPPENPAAQMGKFHLATQNIQVNPEVKKMYLQKRKPPPRP